MEGSSIKKIASHRYFEGLPVKKIKRLYHIKSLPAYDHQPIRKPSLSKIEMHFKEEPEQKIKRFKTHHHLKPPHFGAVKTARERNMQWAKKKQQSSLPSKSLTKSTAYRSPQPQKEPLRRQSKRSKDKRTKSVKKLYSGMMERVKEVVEQYQLRLGRCLEQKQQILKQNMRLKKQLQVLSKKSKRVEK